MMNRIVQIEGRKIRIRSPKIIVQRSTSARSVFIRTATFPMGYPPSLYKSLRRIHIRHRVEEYNLRNRTLRLQVFFLVLLSWSSSMFLESVMYFPDTYFGFTVFLLMSLGMFYLNTVRGFREMFANIRRRDEVDRQLEFTIRHE